MTNHRYLLEVRTTLDPKKKYFESINIKLDRKYLSIQLKNGKPYKGYYFHYL